MTVAIAPDMPLVHRSIVVIACPSNLATVVCNQGYVMKSNKTLKPDRPVAQSGWGIDPISIWNAIPRSDWRCCIPYNRAA
jgi:hypothetical protein